jgi:hypothetical protein
MNERCPDCGAVLYPDGCDRCDMRRYLERQQEGLRAALHARLTDVLVETGAPFIIEEAERILSEGH